MAKKRVHKTKNKNLKSQIRKRNKNQMRQMMAKINKKISQDKFYEEKAKKMVNKKIKELKEQKKADLISKPEEKIVQQIDLENLEDPNEKNGEIEYYFNKINLSELTLKAIKEMGFEKMTEIQAKTIPHILKGNDLIGSAKTGSGKTLSFLIPAFELLHKLKFKQSDGTGVLIISPTRELTLQIYGVAEELLEQHKSRSCGIIMGGNNRNKEVDRLSKNINLIVCTPGRLLDHLQNTKDFKIENLKMLVIDEADQILDNGFEKEMKHIFKLLPKKNRQTIIFSATQTKKIKDLMKLSFQNKPFYVGVDDLKQHSTREGLIQGYVKVEMNQKFLLLLSFLKKNMKKKIIVFFSTCNSTKYYSSLLNFVDIPVLELHGQMKQNKRTNTFFKFSNSEFGCLLATDVAARGLDIPAVDWIIQFDPPNDPKSYIHRVGRTARGINGEGKALMFIIPEQMEYLKKLEEMKVPVKEYEFPESKINQVQEQIESIVSNNYYLGKMARSAYKSYLQSYSLMTDKNIFDIHTLDILKLAKSFGFENPPKIHLNVPLSGKKSRNRRFKQSLQQNSVEAHIATVKQFSR